MSKLVVVEFAVQVASADSQPPGGFRPVPLAFLERAGDELLFALGYREGILHRFVAGGLGFWLFTRRDGRPRIRKASTGTSPRYPCGHIAPVSMLRAYASASLARLTPDL